jgi:type IV pilus assembly protein PilV
LPVDDVIMISQRPRPLTTRSLRRARGFTLIEILVSLLLFSVGILGMAGFQAVSTRTSVDASERSRAALMANEMIAKMWEARSTSLEEDALEEWGERLKEALNKDAVGVVTPLNDDIDAVLITITWPSVARDSTTSTYITEFAIPPYTE